VAKLVALRDIVKKKIKEKEGPRRDLEVVTNSTLMLVKTAKKYENIKYTTYV